MKSQQDSVFGQRIAAKDTSVLVEIDSAYSEGLRFLLLKKFGGPFLRHDDTDGILKDVLRETFLRYDPSRGQSVRSFYFQRGKQRCQDHLRGAYRRELREQIRASRRPGVSSPSADPLEALIALETAQFLQRIKPLIDEALLTLSARQRKAYDHRFGKGGTQWARELATIGGKTPEYWRKASDEAVRKIGKHLMARGVRQKGGRYEVA